MSICVRTSAHKDSPLVGIVLQRDVPDAHRHLAHCIGTAADGVYRIFQQFDVGPDDPIEAAALLMEEHKVSGLPVVDGDGRWLFFAHRGEILSRLMSSLILAEEEG